MAGRVSAGLVMVRLTPWGPEFLLAHPGGPFFARKDDGAWTVPKGIVEPGEDVLETAIREFAEETGFASEPPYVPLGQVKQKSGKAVVAWAFEGDADPARLISNTFDLEWPRGSGRTIAVPEVDRVGWFDLPAARTKLLAAQVPLVERAEHHFRS